MGIRGGNDISTIVGVPFQGKGRRDFAEVITISATPNPWEGQRLLASSYVDEYVNPV